METTKMSINRGMDQEDEVHIYDRIILMHKKEPNKVQYPAIWIATRDYCTKWSQKEKDKYHTISLTCGI